MKTFAVNKNVNKEPYIIGLRLPLFFIFFSILILSIFFFVSGITTTKLIAVSITLVVSYTILNRMNTGSVLGFFVNDKFPNTIINDNYR